jgi:hypothetical protein
MSIFERSGKDSAYVYFQEYSQGRRRVQYLGPRDDISTWEKAERLFLAHLDQKLEDFYSRIPADLRAKVQPKERRRLPYKELVSFTSTELLKALESSGFFTEIDYGDTLKKDLREKFLTKTVLQLKKE